MERGIETERDGTKWNEREKVLGSGLTEVVGDELGKVGEQGCKNGESEWHRRHLSPPQALRGSVLAHLRFGLSRGESRRCKTGETADT